MKVFNGLKLVFSDFVTWYRVSRKIPHTGYIYGYISRSGRPFGSGKTLSMVDYISKVKTKYAGNLVEGKTLHINIFSNLQLNLSSEYCHCFYVDNLDFFIKSVQSFSERKDSKAVYYNFLLLDEIGAVFNSRNFSKNFTPDFLAKLVTMRHFNCSCLWTAQNFSLVDKVFRDLTIRIAECSHVWRFYKNRWWIPSDYELRLQGIFRPEIKPIKKTRLFAWPEIFTYYDSFAAFEQLKKDVESGNYLTSKEIAEKYASPNYVAISEDSRRKRRGLFRQR